METMTARAAVPRTRGMVAFDSRALWRAPTWRERINAMVRVTLGAAAPFLPWALLERALGPGQDFEGFFVVVMLAVFFAVCYSGWLGGLAATASGVLLVLNVATVAPALTVQWETVSLAEWFAAGAFVACGTLASLFAENCRRDQQALVAAATEAREDEGRALLGEQKLEEAVSQLHAMVEHGLYGKALVTPEGRIQVVNRKLEEDTGFTREELVGRSIDELVPERFRERHEGYRRQYLANPTPRGMGTGVRQLFVRCRDGGEFPADIVLLPVRIGSRSMTLVSVHNATETIAAQRQLSDLAQRLDRATEAGGLGVWEYDAGTQKVVVFGQSTLFRGLEGTFQREIALHDFLAPILDEDRARVRSKLLEVPDPVAGSVYQARAEYRMLSTGGASCHMVGHARIEIDAEGRVFRATGTELDMTEAKRIGEMLRDAQKHEAVGQLSGSLAHDFNNLLGIVLGNLDLVLESMPGSDPLGDRIQVAIGAADRAAEVTRSLLKVARREPLTLQLCELNSLIEELKPLLATSLGKSVRLEFELGDGLPTVPMDASALSHAVLNLAINSRDALAGSTADARVVVRTSLLRVDATEHPMMKAGLTAVVSIEDNGPGMTPEVQERVFEPFFTTKGAGQGTGLGLAIVRAFTEQLGGGVRVTSVPGEGTVVQMLFPTEGRS